MVAYGLLLASKEQVACQQSAPTHRAFGSKIHPLKMLLQSPSCAADVLPWQLADAP